MSNNRFAKRKQKTADDDVLFICECGEEEWVTRLGFKKKRRCTSCSFQQVKDLSRVRSKKRYWKIKKKRLSGKKPLCSCGCGRLRGKGKRFLSDYCFRMNREDGRAMP